MSKHYSKIIAGFPGIGKTYFTNRHQNAIDSDSSAFSWTIDTNNVKTRNKEFPQNYIRHIKENMGKYEYIFVSTHKEVREALKQNEIMFYLMYPLRCRKTEFMQRYKERGSSEEFINLVDASWDKWIDEIEAFEGCYKICMVDNIEKEINKLNESEVRYE